MNNVAPANLAKLRKFAASMTHGLWVADLADIIASKRAADRPRERAVVEILEKTLREKNHSRDKHAVALAALRKESERAELD